MRVLGSSLCKYSWKSRCVSKGSTFENLFLAHLSGTLRPSDFRHSAHLAELLNLHCHAGCGQPHLQEVSYWGGLFWCSCMPEGESCNLKGAHIITLWPSHALRIHTYRKQLWIVSTIQIKGTPHLCDAWSGPHLQLITGLLFQPG